MIPIVNFQLHLYQKWKSSQGFKSLLLRGYFSRQEKRIIHQQRRQLREGLQDWIQFVLNLRFYDIPFWGCVASGRVRTHFYHQEPQTLSPKCSARSFWCLMGGDYLGLDYRWASSRHQCKWLVVLALSYAEMVGLGWVSEVTQCCVSLVGQWLCLSKR